MTDAILRRKPLYGISCSVMVVAASLATAADFHSWAPTPPMGWNSWVCYGSLVDEATVKANADVLAAKFLPFGYEYCVVDIRWTVQNETSAHYNQKNPQYTLDEFGRYLPAPNRFPSAAGGKGFKPLADYVHAKGLKFGIHIMRGVPKEAVARKLPVKGAPGVTCDMITDGELECRWLKDNCTVHKDRKGAQEYYDSILELYASWGVDFLKCDDLSAPGYHRDEVEMLRRAIDKCGRKIVLSTSPGKTPIAEAAHVAAHANMWRMVDDVWDRWRDLVELTPVACDWMRRKPVAGAYPDCDIIPLGRIQIRGWESPGGRLTKLTRDEQIYQMTLWAICRSPLMIGSDLPSIRDDEWTVGLLTNRAVLRMHRESRDISVVRCDAKGAEITSRGPDGETYRAVFNLTGEATSCRLEGTQVEMWSGKTVSGQIPVPAHGAVLLMSRPGGQK